MQFGHLLFSFNGRITRSKYWLGLLLVTFGGAALMLLAMVLTGGGLGGKDANLGGLAVFGLLLLPILGLMGWCGLAVQVKRFHDRGRSGWFSALPMAISLISTFLMLSAATAADPYAGAGMLAPLSGLGGLVNLWLFVELGCLPGTDGPNKYDGAGGTPSRAKPAVPAETPFALDGAQAAMDRAIADRENAKPSHPPGARIASAVAQPSFAGAGPSQSSFGRRAAR
jgi:uncharacterized membrane protein YhaH (DUF805 family)